MFSFFRKSPALFFLFVIGCSSVPKQVYPMGSPPKEAIYSTKRTETGKASFYYGRWIGRKTANGEIYKIDDVTAAHKTLPFNTKVRVTNLKNGKNVIVRINNRGPYAKGRILDLSLAAAKKIDMTAAGVVPVKMEVLSEIPVMTKTNLSLRDLPQRPAFQNSMRQFAPQQKPVPNSR